MWWLGSGDGEWRNVKVNASGVHGNILTALLEQCADRNAATELKGLQIAIPRSQLPVLSNSGKDGYYWSDLIGLEVVNLQGEALGKVTGLLETGANDVLQVQSFERTRKGKIDPFHQSGNCKSRFEGVPDNGGLGSWTIKTMACEFDVVTLFPEMFDAITKHGDNRAGERKRYLSSAYLESARLYRG